MACRVFSNMNEKCYSINAFKTREHHEILRIKQNKLVNIFSNYNIIDKYNLPNPTGLVVSSFFRRFLQNEL